MKSDEIRPNKRYNLTESECRKLYHAVETLIDDICIDNGYDKTDINASHWMYILYNIKNNIFNTHREILGYTENNVFQYNIDNLNMLYDYIYYPICIKYKQIISMYAFLKMIGIEYDHLLHSFDRRDKVTYTGISIRKKVLKDREKTLENAMISCKGNPIRFLAIGNHEFGWNESKLELIPENKPVITLDSIPDLPKIELSENLSLPERPDNE